MFPGSGWSVFAPTDSIAPAVPGVLAEWSWVEKAVPERFARRFLPLLGPGWMHRCAVQHLLDRGRISWNNITHSFHPSCILPETLFVEPLSRMMEAWEGLQAGTLPKDCVNAAIGMFVAADEPIVTQHFCGPPAERPEGFWREIDLGNCDAQDWTCDVEARSFESMRPIWSQIMQLEATRMALLLENLERIPGSVRGKHIGQARGKSGCMARLGFSQNAGGS